MYCTARKRENTLHSGADAAILTFSFRVKCRQQLLQRWTVFTKHISFLVTHLFTQCEGPRLVPPQNRSGFVVFNHIKKSVSLVFLMQKFNAIRHRHKLILLVPFLWRVYLSRCMVALLMSSETNYSSRSFLPPSGIYKLIIFNHQKLEHNMNIRISIFCKTNNKKLRYLSLGWHKLSWCCGIC